MDLTPQQQEELIEAYCDKCVDDMSYKEMGQVLFEMMVESFMEYSTKDLVDTITTIYDEDVLTQLCEDVGIDVTLLEEAQ